MVRLATTAPPRRRLGAVPASASASVSLRRTLCPSLGLPPAAVLPLYHNARPPADVVYSPTKPPSAPSRAAAVHPPAPPLSPPTVHCRRRSTTPNGWRSTRVPPCLDLVPTNITGRLKFGLEHRRCAGYCIASSLPGHFDVVEKPSHLPSKAPREHKEMDESKSKEGLAELYEVIEDMSVQANVPALAMDEVAPVAISDAAMLAPEKIFEGKGDVKEEGELT